MKNQILGLNRCIINVTQKRNNDNKNKRKICKKMQCNKFFPIIKTFFHLFYWIEEPNILMVEIDL